MRPELVIFDCDGVLVDSEMIASRSLSDHLAAHGFEMPPETIHARFTGKTLPGVMSALVADGFDPPADFLETLHVRDRRMFDRDLEAVPGVADVVTGLRVAVCVASSGTPEKIRANLSTTGLIELFGPHLFSAVHVARPKPAPDLFLHAAGKMSVAPDRCLVVEDTSIGVTAARAASMRVFGFFGASHCGEGDGDKLIAAGADRVFARMSDFPALLDLDERSVS